jgi:hypothetical protein
MENKCTIEEWIWRQKLEDVRWAIKENNKHLHPGELYGLSVRLRSLLKKGKKKGYREVAE